MNEIKEADSQWYTVKITQNEELISVTTCTFSFLSCYSFINQIFLQRSTTKQKRGNASVKDTLPLLNFSSPVTRYTVVSTHRL